MKLYLLLAVALVIESAGNTALSKGMRAMGEISIRRVSDLPGVAARVVGNGYVLGGVALLALFFACYLVLLSWGDISVVLPLTAFGYVLTSALARWLLNEQVSPLRWAGTALILLGVFLISKSASPTTRAEPPGPPNAKAVAVVESAS